MKATELIAELQKYAEKYGDPVVTIRWCYVNNKMTL